MAAPPDAHPHGARPHRRPRAGRRLPLLDRAVATGLGLSGWVRNRRDGSVEAVFSGPADTVAEMLERCRQGPPSSRVDRIDIAEETDPPPAGFDVMPTA